jgi:hypothetical protein
MKANKFLTFCTVLLISVQATQGMGEWSYTTWFIPDGWSKARVWFYAEYFGAGYSKLHLGGTGSLPNRGEDGQERHSMAYDDGIIRAFYNRRIPWYQETGGYLELKDLFYFPYLSPQPQSVYPDHVIVEEGITHIGDWLFQGLMYVKSVSLPSTLEVIGTGAFKRSIMPEIKLGDKVYLICERAFMDCVNLKSITIPAGCRVGIRAFAGDPVNFSREPWVYSGLESVEIKDNVTIFPYVFEHCARLKSVNFSGRMGTIAEGTFYGCGNLSSINFPTDVTTIGNYAFQGCGSLRTVNIPNGVTSIGMEAFRGCSGLQTISIPGSITSIADGTFRETGLPSVDIPNSVASIGADAFRDAALNSINIPNSVASIGDHAFFNCRSLQTFNIPNRMTSISEATFAHSGLTSITVPGNVKEIGREAFLNCDRLISAKICEGVETIGDGSFRSSKLQKISLPASLKRIDSGAFGECSDIRAVECNSTTPPEMDPSAFSGSNLTKTAIYVPHGSVEAYKNAPVWKNFQDNLGTYPAGIMIINGENFIVNAGSKVKLTVKLTPHDAVRAVTWTSSNNSVASVANGVITAHGKGEAVITATSINGVQTDSCKITVK